MFSKQRRLSSQTFQPENRSFAAAIQQALLTAAVGDALGAGIENWQLAEILNYLDNDPNRLSYTRWQRPDKPATSGQPGDVTDDTSMTMCVMAGLTKTMQTYLVSDLPINEFQTRALRHIYQAFLNWARTQVTYSKVDGKVCENYITDHHWPELSAFNDTFGAGDGTMNILMRGVEGTLEALPELAITPTVKNPNPKKYGDGCGALMRVLPIGLMAARVEEIDVFEFGCQSGALTHGDAASYIAAGMGAVLVKRILCEGLSFTQAVEDIRIGRLLQNCIVNAEVAGYKACLRAMTVAKESLNDSGVYAADTLDNIGKACHEKLFTATPVLAQVIFVALAAEKHGWDADRALKFAAIQSGDSDSVAEIVGGFLGIMGGTHAQLSQPLVDGLNATHKAAVMGIGKDFTLTLDAFSQKYQAANKPAMML